MRGVFDQGHATVPAVRLASKMCQRAAAVQVDIEDVIRTSLDIMSAPLGQDDRANELITYE
jgi:hypothetical protein